MQSTGEERFSALLKRFRQEANLTQAALAERAGVSAMGVSHLESGRRTAPRASTVGALAGALGAMP